MKAKEWIALLLAAAVFLGTGFIGAKRAEELNERRAGTVLSELSGLLEGTAESEPAGPYLERLDITGTIDYSGGFSDDSTDVQDLVDEIYLLAEDENNVGLLLYIDSPGGTMSAADDLYYALMDYKAYTGRPIYCYFDSVACSGGYYVAMPADEICANRNCTCVNIGVYITSYNLAGLYEKLGVKQVVIRSSENKGIGLEGTEWTDEQLGIYQSIVDEFYQQFLEVVAEGRGMTVEQVKLRDDGREMTASQALRAGFIDSVDRYDVYVQSVLEHFSEDTELWVYTPEEDWLGSLSKYFGAFSSRSETELLTEFAKAHEGIKVMAYAGGF